eukprot:TRINITY_DN27592_c0_g1_i1.p1 TRINITY_DN27592_c0_g1~~TRINITY_DN27592_c0_g1_i1.p1  ORF type:complete len:428 (+),score=62.56 TRINITY_DN27592_c0_g1_i1:78-1361(+)
MQLMNCGMTTCKRVVKRRKLDGEGKWFCYQHLEFMDMEEAFKEGIIENDNCKVCQTEGDTSKLVLCEQLGCGVRQHIYCCEPELHFMPPGPWYCDVHVPAGGLKFVPEPGDKIQVLFRAEMKWWPAVVIPRDVGYLPRTIPRRGGGAMEGPINKKKLRTKSANFSKSRSPRMLVAAYFGEPLGKKGEFTYLRLDWDQVRYFDPNAACFQNKKTLAMTMAVEMARRFDLDLSNKEQLTFVPSAASSTLQLPVEPQARFLLWLLQQGKDLNQFCVDQGIKFTVARRWFSGLDLAPATESTEVMNAVTTALEGIPQPIETQQPVVVAMPEENDTPDINENPLPPIPPLVTTWSLVEPHLCIPTNAFGTTYGLTQQQLLSWRSRKCSSSEDSYIDSVIRSILHWRLPAGLIESIEDGTRQLESVEELLAAV